MKPKTRVGCSRCQQDFVSISSLQAASLIRSKVEGVHPRFTGRRVVGSCVEYVLNSTRWFVVRWLDSSYVHLVLILRKKRAKLPVPWPAAGLRHAKFFPLPRHTGMKTNRICQPLLEAKRSKDSYKSNSGQDLPLEDISR